MRRRVALAAGLGGLAILTVLVVVLAQQVESRTGTNAIVSVSGVQVTVPASRTRCQRVDVPAASERISVFGAKTPGRGTAPDRPPGPRPGDRAGAHPRVPRRAAVHGDHAAAHQP